MVQAVIAQRRPADVHLPILQQQCRALPAVAGCDDIELFKDLDISGGKLKGRKGFLALVERVKAGGVDDWPRLRFTVLPATPPRFSMIQNASDSCLEPMSWR